MPTYRIQTRRDTHANWNDGDTAQILLAGECGIRTTNAAAAPVLAGIDGKVTIPLLKIGDGSAQWSALPYAFAPGTNPVGGDDNYAAIASPAFTGTVRATDITITDTAAEGPTLTCNASDGGASTLTHETLTVTNVGTAGALTPAVHALAMNVGNSGTAGTLTVGHESAGELSTVDMTYATVTAADPTDTGLESTHKQVANATWVRANSCKSLLLATGTGAPSPSEFADPSLGDIFIRVTS